MFAVIVTQKGFRVNAIKKARVNTLAFCSCLIVCIRLLSPGPCEQGAVRTPYAGMDISQATLLEFSLISSFPFPSLP